MLSHVGVCFSLLLFVMSDNILLNVGCCIQTLKLWWTQPSSTRNIEWEWITSIAQACSCPVAGLQSLWSYLTWLGEWVETEVIPQLCCLRPCLQDIQEVWLALFLLSNHTDMCMWASGCCFHLFPLLPLRGEMELEVDESLVTDSLFCSYDSLKTCNGLFVCLRQPHSVARGWPGTHSYSLRGSKTCNSPLTLACQVLELWASATVPGSTACSLESQAYTAKQLKSSAAAIGKPGMGSWCSELMLVDSAQTTTASLVLGIVVVMTNLTWRRLVPQHHRALMWGIWDVVEWWRPNPQIDPQPDL